MTIFLRAPKDARKDMVLDVSGSNLNIYYVSLTLFFAAVCLFKFSSMDVSSFDQPSRIAISSGNSFAVSQRPKSTYTSSSQSAYATQLSKLHSSCYAVSFSSPVNSISFLDKSSLSLVATIYNAHTDTVTAIRCPPYLSTHLGKDVLISSGRDGVVKAWDTRSTGDQQCVLQCWCFVRFHSWFYMLSYSPSPEHISMRPCGAACCLYLTTRSVSDL